MRCGQMNQPLRAASLALAGRVLLLGTIAVAAGEVRMSAQTVAVPEYEVKAAFLFNIAKYSEWPPGSHPAGAPIIVGVLGEDLFGEALKRQVQGRSVNDRKVVIRRASQLSDLQDAQIIFISASERDRAPQICTLAESWNAVTVGDTSQVEPYAAINFAVVRGRIVFSVNLDAATRAGVRISSKLLHLARSVRGAKATGGIRP